MSQWMDGPRQFKSERIAAKSDGCCYYCGIPLNKRTATYDHVLPRAMGGRSSIANLVIACSPCNQEKAAMTIDDYRAKKGGDPFYGEMDSEQCECHERDEAGEEPVSNPSVGSSKSKSISIPLDGKQPKYVNDPRRVAPPTGRGQQPK